MDAALERYWLRRAGVVLVCLKVALVPVIFYQSFDQPFTVPKALIGHALAYLLGGILAGLFLAFGRRVLLRSWLHVPVLGFFGAAALATVFAQDHSLALFGAHSRMLGLGTIADWTVLYFAVALLVRTRTEAIAVIASIFGASVAVLFYEALQVAGADPFVWSLNPEDRAFSTLGNPTTLAQYLTSLATGSFAIALLVPRVSRSLRIAMVTLAGGLLVGTALTDTRAAAIGLVAGGAALVALVSLKHPERRTRRLTVMAIGASTVALAGLLAFSPIGTRLAFTVQAAPVDAGDDSILTRLEPSAAGRIALYRIGLDELIERPLLGYGPDSFVVGVPRYRPERAPESVRQFPVTSAHSWAVQLGATTGAFGLVLFGAIALVALLLALRAKFRPVAVAGIATMAAFLGTGLTTVSDIGTDWLFWVVAAAVAASTADAPVPLKTETSAKSGRRAVRGRTRRAAPRATLVQRAAPPIALAIGALLSLTVWPAADASLAAMAGTVARLQGRSAQAIEAGLRATRADGGRAEYWEGLGLSYTRTSAWREATAAFDRARTIAPYDARYWDDLIRAQLIQAQAGDAAASARALQLADELVRRDPNNPRAHYSRALTMQVTGNIPEALRSVERALDLDPGSVNQQLYVTATQVLLAAARPDDAVRVARDGIATLGPSRRTTELRVELNKALAALGLPPETVPDPGACTATRWIADRASPQPAGARVTFSVSTTGCDRQESQIAIAGPDTSSASAYLSTGAWSAAHTWDTTGLAPGTYHVYLYTRRAGWTGTYQAFYEGTYVLSR